MENFNYNVIIHNNGNEIVIKTNDVTYAIREYLRADEAGCEVCLCNGYTGEVLCHNGEEPWCTDEMALMILGYMCAEAWGEEDEDEDEPSIFDNLVDVAETVLAVDPDATVQVVPAEEAVADPAVALIASLFGIPADEVVALHNGEGLPS